MSGARMSEVEEPAGQRGFAAQLRRGAAWSVASTVAIRAGQFFVGVAVARIVAPEQFGIMAAALIVHSIIISANDFGVSLWIMRSPTTDPRELPTLNVIAVGGASAAAGLMVAGAPLVANLLGSPEATSAIRILAITVLLAGFSSIPTGLLFRDFRQDRRFISDLANLTVSSVTVLVLVSNGWGADGIAWSRVAGQTVGTVIYMYFAHYFVRLGFDWSIAKRILRFGVPLVGSNIVSVGVSNVDYAVVGRQLGPVSLGYYSLAVNVAGWPSSIMMSVLQTLVAPAAGRFRDDLPRLRRHMNSAMGIVFLAVLPVSAALVALAVPLVQFVYGDKWLPAAGALALLGLAGPWRVGIAVLGEVLATLGATKALLAVKILWIGVAVPVMVLGVRWAGIEGVAAAQAVVMGVVVTPALIVILARLGAIDTRGLLRTIVPLWLAAIAAAGVAWAVGESITNPVLSVAGGGLASLGAYAGSLFLQFLVFRRTGGGWWEALQSRRSEARSDD